MTEEAMATSPQSPPRRPRLSLQIKAISSDSSNVRTSRALAAAVDVKDPATFNALSNVYASAIDRSTPTNEKPPVTVLGSRPSLRLQTQNVTQQDRRLAPSPYRGPYLDTPVTAQAISPSVSIAQFSFPSAMTATPPLSAGPQEQSTSSFTFEPKAQAQSALPETTAPTPKESLAARTPRRSTTLPAGLVHAPYTHPRTLRSILRNSPLPPINRKNSPISPRRQSLRLQEKAARRVGYNSPLCQTITNSRYTRTHMDLLSGGDETPSPFTPNTPDGASTDSSSDSVLDSTMAYDGDETRDGGNTPGPFEEMRRRMATMKATSPLSPSASGGVRKRKKREKKRRWVWTIGEDAEDEDLSSPVVGGGSECTIRGSPIPITALPSPRPRTRQQVAVEAAARAAGFEVPTLAVPVPVAASAAKNQVPIITVPAPGRLRTRLQNALLAPAVTPAVLPSLRSETDGRLAVAPAPSAMIPRSLPAPPEQLEPPTPSADSSVSQDSLFDRAASMASSVDVDMSDISSFASETEHVKEGEGETHLMGGDTGGGGLDDGDGDDEMDTDTPIATVKPGGGLGMLGVGDNGGWMMAGAGTVVAPGASHSVSGQGPGDMRFEGEDASRTPTASMP